MQNHKNNMLHPLNTLEWKPKSEWFRCLYWPVLLQISHRTFGISLQVISDLIKAITEVRQLFLRQHSIHQIRNEQVVTVLAFIGVLEKENVYIYNIIL